MLTNTLISALPVILLILMMIVCKVSSHWSALTTMAATCLIALFAAPSLGLIPEPQSGFIPMIVGASLAEGLAKALFPILSVIIMALFSYNILLRSGYIEVIKQQLAGFGSDPGLLVLLLTWGFGGLLEGIAGFGTAVAIPAAILVGLGFKPFFSAMVCLISNTVFSDFGAVGINVLTLVGEMTGSTPAYSTLTETGTMTIMQLIPMFFLIPFLILTLTDRRFRMRNIGISLLVGAVGIAVQFICVSYLGIQTPSIIAPIISILLIIGIERLAVILSRKKEGNPIDRDTPRIPFRKALRAWSIYILIIVMILLTGGMIPDLYDFLSSRMVTEFSFESTGTSCRLAWLGNAALWIGLGSILGGLIQNLSIKEIGDIFIITLYKVRFSALTIICLICMATVMGHTGMTRSIAEGMIAMTGNSYPAFAPLVGAAGTFITGSGTSSQILFGKLQAGAAAALGCDGQSALWLGAANLSGAACGKIISPQSIAIASAAGNMTGVDYKLLRRGIPYTVMALLLTGAIVAIGFCSFLQPL